MGLLSFLNTVFGDDGTSSSTGSASEASSRGSRTAPRRARSSTARMQVYDGNGDVRHLDTLLNKGGEGRVYPLANSPDALVKLYHPSVLASSRSSMVRDKLSAMTTLTALRRNPRFGWPRILVYDDQGTWLGYAMRRVPGFQLQTLCQPQLVRERIPHWSRRDMVACAASFVDLVREAHQQGIILGDINPANFLIDPQTCAVHAIDCDSYQIKQGNRFYPCPVGIPMLMAPELLSVDYGNVRRTVDQELFAVAIMLFRMLMLGLHPYSRTYGEDPVQNLKSGQCALGLGCGFRLPEGPWYRIWSHLPGYVKERFIQTFRDGHSDPAERATLNDWSFALERYQNDISKGWFDLSLVPRQPKSSAYKGRKPLSANANTILGGKSGFMVRESCRPVRKHGMGRPLQRV